MHFRCCGRERTKAISVFLYPPVMHRGNGWVSYILQGWCYFPFLSPSLFSPLLSLSLFPLVLHAHLQNYNGNYDALRVWHGFVPQRDAGPCHRHLPAAAGWGGCSTVGSEPHWAVRELQSPFWVPPSSESPLGPKGTPLSSLLTCALWSLFSSSCLINCFVSFSSFLLFLRALFAFKRHRGKEKGNQSTSLPWQLSSKLPRIPEPLGLGLTPGTVWAHPCPLQGQKGNIHGGTFTCTCCAGFKAFQAPKATLSFQIPKLTVCNTPLHIAMHGQGKAPAEGNSTHFHCCSYKEVNSHHGILPEALWNLP